MAEKKDAKAKGHDKSNPRDPKWQGQGSKPGQKNAPVVQHKRTRPKKG